MVTSKSLCSLSPKLGLRACRLLAVAGLLWAASCGVHAATVNATLDNASSVTVAPGATVTAELTVTTSGSGAASRWRTTSYQIGAAAAVCVNVPDPNADGAGTYIRNFPITAPTAAGSYNVVFNVWANDSCGSNNGSTTLTGGIIVSGPSVTAISRVTASPTNASSVQWTVTFNRSVTGVNAGDFALVVSGLAGTSITSVTGSGSSYTVTASTGSGTGTLGLNLVDDDTIADPGGTPPIPLGGTGLGNGNFTGEVYTVDRTAPTVTKSFTPNTITTNGSSTLAVTITNNQTTAISSVAFTDAYPGGGALVNASTTNLTNTCGGIATAAPSGTSLTLSGGSIPGGGNCSVSVTVTATAAGAYLNSTGIVTSDNAANGAAGTATLTVNAVVITVASFDVVQVGAAKATRIPTKLAGIAFSLDVLALDSGGNIAPAYAGTVTVELVNGATGGGVCGSMTALQNLGNLVFAVGNAGRKTLGPINYANASRDTRVRITDSSAGVTSCSFDNFSIRPQAFSSVTSTLNNAGTSGVPFAKAGAPFTISATALPGYDGTPVLDLVDPTKISAHAGATAKGNLAGSFSAANSLTGTAQGAAFTYSEVGHFTIAANGVYDSTFTSVDAPGDCTNDFSNALVGGLYGCRFGNNASTAPIGRFTPDHFSVLLGTLTDRRQLSCAPTPSLSFTYEGEQLRVTFMLTARNGLATPTKTENYTTASGFAKLDPTMYSNLGIGAIDLADLIPPLTATSLNSRVSSGTSTGTWLAGTTNVTVDFVVTRAASPDGPFESVRIGVLPAEPAGADGVTLRTADLDLDTDVPSNGNDRVLVGSTRIRFGRLRVGSVNGSQLVPLRVPVAVDYWAQQGPGSGFFVINTDDQCTSLAATNIEMTSFTGNLGPIGPCRTTISSMTTLSAGRGNLQLSPPGSNISGSVSLRGHLGATGAGEACVNGGSPTKQTTVGAGMPYLQGDWTGAAYDQNPVGRGTFGTFPGATEVIFIREIF